MLTKTLAAAVVASAVAGGAVGAVAGWSAGRRAARQERDASPRRGVDFAAAGVGMGMFEVTSAPGGARVTMDGRIVGKTPILRLDAAPGTHAFVVELEGHAPWVGEARVKEGGGASVHAILEPAAAPPAPAVAAGPAPPPERPRARPAPRPKIDCSGPAHDCKERCGDAAWDCETRCQFCGSCVTGKTWEECNAICSTCKQGCEQNKRFCLSGCEGQESACRSMQP